jgi:lysylphosphatidylglycerol synthetase-like protein (DUF2156 family)
MKNPFKSKPNRPTIIIVTSLLILIFIILGAINIPGAHEFISNKKTGFALYHSKLIIIVGSIFYLLILLLNLFIFLGKNWARILFIIFCIYYFTMGTSDFIFIISMIIYDKDIALNALLTTISIFLMIILIITSLILMNLKKSREWFKKKVEHWACPVFPDTRLSRFQ